LHDEIAVIDDALTRPWTVTTDHRRNPNPRPNWHEFICAAVTPLSRIGKETYFLSAETGQTAPELRYFK
jgi:hypothetical protein